MGMAKQESSLASRRPASSIAPQAAKTWAFLYSLFTCHWGVDFLRALRAQGASGVGMFRWFLKKGLELYVRVEEERGGGELLACCV